jgi:hypothetical protein
LAFFFRWRKRTVTDYTAICALPALICCDGSTAIVIGVSEQNGRRRKDVDSRKQCRGSHETFASNPPKGVTSPFHPANLLLPSLAPTLQICTNLGLTTIDDEMYRRARCRNTERNISSRPYKLSWPLLRGPLCIVTSAPRPLTSRNRCHLSHLIIHIAPVPAAMTVKIDTFRPPPRGKLPRFNC